MNRGVEQGDAPIVVLVNNDRGVSLLDAAVHASGEAVVAVEFDEADARKPLSDQLGCLVLRTVVDDDRPVLDRLRGEMLEAPLKHVAPVPRRNDDVDGFASFCRVFASWECSRRATNPDHQRPVDPSSASVTSRGRTPVSQTTPPVEHRKEHHANDCRPRHEEPQSRDRRGQSHLPREAEVREEAPIGPGESPRATGW